MTRMTLKPQNLFLIDGLGALVSAFFLGVVLVRFEQFFGMPVQSLYFLAFLPCLFFIYDLWCYFRIRSGHQPPRESQKSDWRPYLKAIAIVNLLYCLLSLFFFILHYNLLTKLGVAYFIVEVLIVIPLAVFELKIANSSTL